MKKLSFLFLFLISLIFVSCKNNNNLQTTTVDDYKLKIASPSGAPLIAISGALDGKDYETNLNLAPTLLPAYFGNGSVDFIVAPINMGAQLYKKSANFKLASVLTWGNLFFASKDENFDELADVNNADLVLFGEGTVNDAVVNYVLTENNITPKTKEYKADTQETQSLLLNDNDNKIFLVAEPALSAAKTKDSTIKSISVQSLFEAKSGAKKFTQAGLFVNIKTANEHKGLVDSFINDVKKSCIDANNNADKIIDSAIKLGITTPKAVLTKAITGCNISFKKAKEAKEELEFTANLMLNLFGGSLPENEFYYE